MSRQMLSPRAASSSAPLHAPADTTTPFFPETLHQMEKCDEVVIGRPETGLIHVSKVGASIPLLLFLLLWCPPSQQLSPKLSPLG
jgi:hypothetical protein